MVNAIYNVASQRFALALIDWSVAPLILLAYSGNPEFVASDASIAEIAARGNTLLIGTSQAILGMGVSPEGYLQTGSVVIPDVEIGYPITHFIMTLNGTLPLLYVDEAYELPFEPNGLDILVTPDWLWERGWGRL